MIDRENNLYEGLFLGIHDEQVAIDPMQLNLAGYEYASEGAQLSMSDFGIYYGLRIAFPN